MKLYRGATLVLCFMFFSGSICNAVAESFSAPVINIKECAKAPVIDGKLNDACWQNAYSDDNFYVFQNPERRSKSTTLKVTADDKFLYLGFKCRHSKPEDMKVTLFKNNSGRVFGDECVKLFIFPDKDKERYLRYVLNPANTHNFSSFANPNWRTTPYFPWPSATSITKDGWEAEIAISLWYMGGFVRPEKGRKRGDLSHLRFNAFRRNVIIRFDENAVPMSEESTITSLAPLRKSWINYQNLASIKGLGKIRPVKPFIASIMKCSMSNLQIREGKKFYDIDMTLRAWTGNKGTLKLEVIDKPKNGARRVFLKNLVFNKNIQEFRYRLPVESVGAHKITVLLKDPQNDGIIASETLENNRMFDAFLDRSYYTMEVNAKLIVNAALTRETLKGTCITVYDKAGKVIAEQRDPESKCIISLNLKAFSIGVNEIKVDFTDAAKQQLYSRTLSLRKLPPNPGREWKIDRENRIILRNGKPFFPFGIWGQFTRRHMEEYKTMGFNWVEYTPLYCNPPGKLQELLNIAEKNNIVFSFRPNGYANAKQLKTVNEYVRNKSLKKQIYAWSPINFMLIIKNLLLTNPAMLKLTRQQRNEIFAEAFKANRAIIHKSIELTKNSPALIGYSTLDEPYFSTFDMFHVLREIYQMIMKIDGYHPVFILYSLHIPARPEATEGACDVLGIDPYWVPGRPQSAIKNSIVTVPKYISKLEKRAEEDHLVSWSLPAASWWSQTHKRPFTGREIICQTYLSLIYGVKAISYFLIASADHQSQFDAYVRLGKEMKALSPVILAPRQAQKIAYLPGGIDFDRDIIPDVHACLMRNPRGGHVLLATNCRNYPVKTTFEINGMSGDATGFFDGKKYSVENFCFADNFEALAVRIYKLQIQQTAEDDIKITVRMKADKKGYVWEAGIPKTGVSNNKNILPNPGFEETALPNWPDYYRLLADPSPLPRIGNPDAPWGTVTGNPFEGKYCLRSIGQKWFLYIAPQSKKPEKYRFSVYMRTDHPGARVSFNYKGCTANFVLKDKGWKHYESIITVPANTSLLSKLIVSPSNKKAAIWFDKMSMEKVD